VYGLGMTPALSNPVASHQPIEVVVVGSVSAEGLLIEQPFDAASETNLIGMILEANRPTHVTVPAAA
jgi:hypothetical protein